jgi:hypothetical protein
MTHAPFFTPAPGYAGPKRSLILAGGGMRVAYQAGVLQALAEAGLCFHHADGTSGGTMNLAMLFSGLSPPEMIDRWRSLDPKDFAGFMPLADYLRGPNLPAMGSADGVVNKVFPHLGIDVARINDAAGIIWHVQPVQLLAQDAGNDRTHCTDSRPIGRRHLAADPHAGGANRRCVLHGRGVDQGRQPDGRGAPGRRGDLGRLVYR